MSALRVLCRYPLFPTIEIDDAFHGFSFLGRRVWEIGPWFSTFYA